MKRRKCVSLLLSLIPGTDHLFSFSFPSDSTLALYTTSSAVRLRLFMFQDRPRKGREEPKGRENFLLSVWKETSSASYCNERDTILSQMALCELRSFPYRTVVEPVLPASEKHRIFQRSRRWNSVCEGRAQLTEPV